MRKNALFAIIAFGLCSFVNAQVGINTNLPNSSLDIVAKAANVSEADGILVPRLTVTQLSAKDVVYGTAQEGALVYITSGTGTAGKTINITGAGFYYYNSLTAKWTPLGGASGSWGNGNFTPKNVQIANGSAANWTALSAVDGNYFEIITGSTLPFPDFSLFANRTIYLRNNTGGLITFDSAVPSLVGLGSLTAGSTIQLYSDGSRWYLMSGRN